MKNLRIHKLPFKNVIFLAIECKMHLKIQKKLRCLSCISKQTMRSAIKKTRLNSSMDDFLMKSFPSSTKRKLSFLSFWTFSFHFLSLNGVFLTLKCRTLGLTPPHGDAWQPFCWKWKSFTEVSKYGKSEYSRALNASYTFQPLRLSDWTYRHCSR